MTIVGVLYITSITTPPTSSQTPAIRVLSHVSDHFPAQVHQPFHLDHRLFVSTSSLLPQSENRRTFTHILTSTHSPDRTYIGTTRASTPPDTSGSKDTTKLSTITIPTSTALEPFTNLLIQKLQPQWAARQFLVSDNGASLTLPIVDDGKWRFSVADLRLAQAKVSGGAAGQLRGMVIELQYEPPASSHAGFYLSSEEGKKQYEALFHGLLRALFRNLSLELKLDDAKIHFTETHSEVGVQQGETGESGRNGTSSPSADDEQDKQQKQQQEKPAGHEIAELYMNVLRGSQG